MSPQERAAYDAWKRACAAAQEGETQPRERCGTLLGLAAVTVVLIVGVWGGGARADDGPSIPRYDVDGACAAYVDAGLSPFSSSGASRSEIISICVEWEQRRYDELRAKWDAYPKEARSGCQREVAEKIRRGSIQGVNLGSLGQSWSKASEAWGYDWLSACVETYRAEPKRFRP
jgi:hypothetical protein